jgi:hypothetical protein
LWLESSEMGVGRWIDGFALKRVDPAARFDPRCKMIRDEDGGIELSSGLRLDITETQVREVLGKPTARFRSTLIFDHERPTTIRSVPYAEYNTVYIGFRGGVVTAIQVWKSTEGP